MKTIKTFYAALVSAAILSPLTSCSNDNSEEPSTPGAIQIAGTYQGNLTSTVMGSESIFENMEANVTATDDTTVTIQIPEFGEAPMNMPSITVEGVKVNETESCYSMAVTDFNGTSSTGKTYSGTLKGDVTDGKLNIQFTLNYGAMPMPLICTFTGSK